MAANYDQPLNVEKRTRFFDGQYLQDQDFIDEQKYHVDRQRRHNRTLHVAGICDGLGVDAVQGSKTKVTIAAGTAIDANGRQLVLVHAQTIELPSSQLGNKTASLYLVYGEQPADPQEQAGLRDFSRWLEQPEVKVAAKQDKLESKYPPVLLAEIPLDANGNITRIDSSVREYSGLRLPSPNPNAPTLRSDASGLVRLEGGLSVSGKAGIGTASIKQDLTVNGRVYIENGVIQRGGDAITTTNDLGLYSQVEGNWMRFVTKNAPIRFFTDGGIGTTARLLIDQAGNVCIGAAVPAGKLDVQGSVYVGTGANNESHKLVIRGPNRPTDSSSFQDLSYEFTSAGSAKVRAYRGNSWDTCLQFLTNPANAGSDSAQVRMMIDHVGNVGIGTTSPKAFQVTLPESSKAGNAPGTGVTIAGGDSASIELRGTGTPYIDFAKDAATTDYHARIRLADTDKLAIEGANVGIGTTDPKSKLAINSKIAHDGGFSGFGEAQLTIFDPTHNGGSSPNGTRDILHLVREGVSGQAYGNKASFALGRYEHNGTNSRTQLDIKLTDGSFASHTAVMTLRSNGNVGIGTTNPGAYRLNVSGGDACFSGNLVNNGNVGIGTSNIGTFKLAIVHDSHLAVGVESSSVAGTWLRLNNTSTGGRNWNVISSGKDNGEKAGKLLINDQSSGGGTRLVIDTVGNVGLGTAAPKQRLHVVGDYYGKGHLWLHAYEGDGESGTAFLQARDDSTTSSINLRLRAKSGASVVENMTLRSDGGTQVHGNLHVHGQLVYWWGPDNKWKKVENRANNYAGSYDANGPSDMRFKTALAPIRNALHKVLHLQGKCYRWSETGLRYLTQHITDTFSAGPGATVDDDQKVWEAERRKAYQALSGDKIGLIAQELEDIVPEVVHEDEKGYKYVQYQQLTALLIEAIKEQHALVQSLSAKVAILEGL